MVLAASCKCPFFGVLVRDFSSRFWSENGPSHFWPKASKNNQKCILATCARVCPPGESQGVLPFWHVRQFQEVRCHNLSRGGVIAVGGPRSRVIPVARSGGSALSRCRSLSGWKHDTWGSGSDYEPFLINSYPNHNRSGLMTSH